MDLCHTHKVYIVAGSSRGIGRGIAAVLLEEGATVVITGREPLSLDETFRKLNDSFPGRVLSFAGDLGVPEILSGLEREVMTRYSRIDGVIANLGAVKPVSDWEIGEEEWDWYLEMNFRIPVRFVTRFIPHLRKTTGSIVFVGSIAGIEDIGAPLPYSASKAAVTMYAKGLARKLAPNGIRVNSVAPGNVVFPDGNWDRKRTADPAGVHKMLEERVPLRTFGTPEDIGGMVAYLLSEKARFITGGCFVVDGGQSSSFP